MSGRYDLRAPPEAVEALRTGGFDVVSLANNHTMDTGRNGMVDTIAVLTEAGIAPVPPAHRHARPDLGVAFVALDDSTGALEPAVASEVVARAAQSAGLVVASVHWGGEYQTAPSERQQSVARALADAGADVVVGHGPHVLQRVEWYGETLVAYSLGNFLFDQPYPKDLRWGAILCVRARAGRAVSVVALPTVVWRGRVHLAGRDDHQAILRRLGLPAPVES
jgi:poly-gamma-glutamate synthesis protein (capsule biosynthesis protein)